ncbi:MAG: tetratricopeptide repeat protein [Gammaproteobacteria bacterium]
MQQKSLNEYIEQIKNLVQSKNYLDCIELLNDAIRDFPQENKLKLNLGNIYKLVGKNSQAIDVYLSLINSDFSAFANNNLSLIYLELGEYDKSIEHAKNALDINDDYHDAKYNLALSLFEKKDYAESLLLANNLINVESHKAKAYELKIRIEQLICDWSSYEDTNELLRKNKIIVHPFLHISHVMDNEKNQINARYWTNQLSNNKKDNSFPRPKSKIKLGFLCGEIRNHPTYYLIRNLFKHIDKEIFSVFMFSYNHNQTEKNEIVQYFTDFVDLDGLDDNDANKCLSDYSLDILIDLTTIISHNRQSILNDNSAKFIISYLAFPGTTGSSLYDFMLTDKTVTPGTQQNYFEEKFLFLPNTYQVNNGEVNITEITARESFGLPADGLILGSLNQSFKLDPVLFEIWLQIIQKHDNTYLWLLDENDEMKKNINNFIGDRIDLKRIIYAKRLDYPEHLSRIQHIDIALDTRIYNGHTTSIEMIQSCIPLVTLKGNHFASRVSASLLEALNMDELITTNIDDYKETVSSLIENKTMRNKIKNTMRVQLKESSLLDIRLFAESFQKTILKIFT